MTLSGQIDDKRKEIRADGYQMSIGEICNMYRDADLDIHPAYQRFFRWDDTQKTRWIESILLGIPTPSIFVAQRKDGIWDVVDGLQRLSTIFEFIGILKKPNGDHYPPLVLQGTRDLPLLDGVSFDTGDNPMDEDTQRFLKREKLDIKIIKRESDDQAKYELFQRLNTGGSSLSPQEVRNCLIVANDTSLFDWLNHLAEHEAFTETVPLPVRLDSERFDIELALRFILFRSIDPEQFKGLHSLSDFITDRMLTYFLGSNFDRDTEEEIFIKTFNLVQNTMGDDAFKKYDRDKEQFSGAFLQSAFEIIAMGIAHNGLTSIEKASQTDLHDTIVTQVWGSPEQVVAKTGESAVARLRRTLPIGRAIFS